MSGRRAWSTLPYYVGGFLGPFGGPIVAVLIPQLRLELGASTEAVALAIPAYLAPFALLQLVSGTIGERLGRRRVVRTSYVVYAVCSVGLAAAPGIEAFLALRACLGAANAFLTPILLASLAEQVAPRRLGRAMGTFAAVQTAAIASAPLLGGIAGEVDWRVAVVLPGAVAAALAVTPLPADRRRSVAVPALRSLLTERVALLSASAFVAHTGITGISFLVAIEGADAFALGSTERGLVVAGFGLSGVASGRAGGALVDRFGAPAVIAVAALGCGALVGTLGIAGSLAPFVAAWVGAGVCSAFLWAGMNKLTVEAVPANRAGATSVVFAFKFAGQAAAPIAWLPLYAGDAALGFGAAAATGALVGPLMLLLGRTPQPASAGGGPPEPTFPR